MKGYNNNNNYYYYHSCLTFSVGMVLLVVQQPLQLTVLGEEPRLLLFQLVNVLRRLLQNGRLCGGK